MSFKWFLMSQYGQGQQHSTIKILEMYVQFISNLKRPLVREYMLPIVVQKILILKIVRTFQVNYTRLLCIAHCERQRFKWQKKIHTCSPKYPLTERDYTFSSHTGLIKRPTYLKTSVAHTS